MTDAVIDLDALRKLKAVIGDDPEMLGEFFDVFTRSVPGLVENMRTAEETADIAGLRIAAHSCKSNARDLGALKLADLCATLETQSRIGVVEDPVSQIAGIDAEVKRAIEALNAMDPKDV